MAQAIDALTELVGAEAARRIVEFRRDMHQHPEIGMDTARAADKIEACTRLPRRAHPAVAESG